MLSDSSPSTPEQSIIAHYNRYDESRRLRNDIGPLEKARTSELILARLPHPPATLVDVGGANGVYSFWLAGLGYEVHLVDLVPRHIEEARQMQAEPGCARLASLRVGDARCLNFPDACADAVILHGPLYHLPERTERIRALREAARLLKAGGLLFAFAITRYAGLIYGLSQGHVFDPQYLRMIRTEVQTGLRQDPPPWAFTLPNAYFHLPSELGPELEESGLRHEGTLGVLGPAWQVPDLDASWQDETRRAVLLEIARLTENEPVLGPRLLALGRKPVE
jgi:ubiquinone/menaquinone biosynthesis C-methylase UbiE